MAKLVDARDLKSLDFGHTGSTPVVRTKIPAASRIEFGSKRSSAMLRSSATRAPPPPSEQMGSGPPRLPLEKRLSIRSCRYGVRAGRPAPQSKPYGFTSDLVVTASDQRPDAVAAAAVTMSVRAFAPHYMRYWVRFQHRKRIKADRWQSGRRGHTDRANEDRSKNVTHLVTPFGPIGPWP